MGILGREMAVSLQPLWNPEVQELWELWEEMSLCRSQDFRNTGDSGKRCHITGPSENPGIMGRDVMLPEPLEFRNFGNYVKDNISLCRSVGKSVLLIAGSLSSLPFEYRDSRKYGNYERVTECVESYFVLHPPCSFRLLWELWYVCATYRCVLLPPVEFREL